MIYLSQCNWSITHSFVIICVAQVARRLVTKGLVSNESAPSEGLVNVVTLRSLKAEEYFALMAPWLTAPIVVIVMLSIFRYARSRRSSVLENTVFLIRILIL